MRSGTACLLIAAMTAGSVVVLLLVATFRFETPLVYPAPLPPDYGVQAAVSVVSMVAALVCGICACLCASRRPAALAVIVGWTGVALLVGILLGAVLAFALSAR